MNVKVVYYSETGNTKKIAEAIAQHFDITAELITDELAIQDVDILFVGGFLKAFTLVKPTKVLLKRLQEPSMTKHVAVFATSSSGLGILKYAKKYIKNPTIQIIEDDFKCKGSYGKRDADRPNEADFAEAKNFAQRVLKRYGS